MEETWDDSPFGGPFEVASSEAQLRATIETGAKAAVVAADRTKRIIDLLGTEMGETDPFAAIMELLLVIEAKQDRMLALLQPAPPSSAP